MKQTQGRGESGAARTQKRERLPDIDDDALLTLEEAARRAFPSGGGTAATLKRKIRKGQLTSYRPGKAYMTTMRDVKAMIALCAVPAKRNSIAAIDQDLDALLNAHRMHSTLPLARLNRASHSRRPAEHCGS
jgi:hypothetical protein